MLGDDRGIAKLWKGSISSEGSSNHNEHEYKTDHWTGTAKVVSDEVNMQSIQYEGMSRKAVSNGCGYLGMNHAVLVEPFALQLFLY